MADFRLAPGQCGAMAPNPLDLDLIDPPFALDHPLMVLSRPLVQTAPAGQTLQLAPRPLLG